MVRKEIGINNKQAWKAIVCIRRGQRDREENVRLVTLLLSFSYSSRASRRLRVFSFTSYKDGKYRGYPSLFLSNIGYYVGTKLINLFNENETKSSLERIIQRGDLQQILSNLLRSSSWNPKDVGRQLASSDCARVLLELLFYDDEDNACMEVDETGSDTSKQRRISTEGDEENIEAWRNLVLKLTQRSFEMRESFGSAAIQRVLANDYISNSRCEFLCYFAQDAWSRVILRESGALDRLLDALDDPRRANAEREQAKIISSLKYFAYDAQSMAHICQHEGFLRVALRNIRRYVDENRITCLIQYMSSEEVRQRDANAVLNTDQEMVNSEKNLNKGSEETEIKEKLHKDFSFSGQETLPGCSRADWSPSMSPSTGPDTTYYSPGSSPNASLTMSPLGSFLEEYLSSQDFSAGFSPECLLGHPTKPLSKDANVPLKQEKWSEQEQVAKDCVSLISMLSHQAENYPQLIKEEVLHTIIDHISDAPVMDNRLTRCVKRLARSKNSLQALLEMNFHQLIINKLILRDCILARFSKNCLRCRERLEFGRDVFNEFYLHADSDMGWHFLQSQFRTEDEDERVRGQMNILILIRNSERRSRIFHHYMPVETLLSTLAGILENFASEENFAESRKGQLCCDILYALSSLLSRRRLDQIPDLNVGPLNIVENFHSQTADTNESACGLIRWAAENIAKDNPEEQLEFYGTQSGQLVTIVPKAELCARSAYFKGMFGNDFAEKTRQRFDFDETDTEVTCSEADFNKFLHYLLGCRHSNCVNNDHGSQMCAILYLADRYLCSELYEELLTEGGLARSSVDGESLKSFLPLVLSIESTGPKLAYLCVLTLLRYSNREQITTTLAQFLGNGAAVYAFIQLIREFLLFFAGDTMSPNISSRTHHNAPMLWDFLNVPFRVRVRLSRRRNDDEDSPHKLYTLVTHVPVTSFKRLTNVNVESEE
ncbi:60S ribosomal protein L31 [Ditylenchus destructor]|nr:60S ribosomal protein L31 [Ditylenchus destructor]